MADLRSLLEALLAQYGEHERIPKSRLQYLLDYDDSYKTGKGPSRFYAVPSQAEGGRCIE